MRANNHDDGDRGDDDGDDYALQRCNLLKKPNTREHPTTITFWPLCLVGHYFAFKICCLHIYDVNLPFHHITKVRFWIEIW